MGSRRSKAVTIQLTTEHEHDFWARVDRSDEGDCWIWTGYKDKDGYPSLRIDKERLGAPRVAWVLHHRQPLPSYQQVRRRCKSKGCVRPTHMTRVNTSYSNFSKRRPNSTFTVLKPPEGGKTEAPKQEAVAALTGSYKELQQLRIALHALTGALPQSDRKQQKNHEKTHTCVTELVESVESLREEMMRWTARVDQRLIRLERAVAPVEPPSQPKSEPDEPAQPEPSKPEVVAEPVNGHEPEGMSLVLMNAWKEQFGGPREPHAEDYESLDMVFDIALGESHEPSGAVERFGAWLSSFHRLTLAHPTMEPTPQGFAREVAARRLESE
jgi:hypothetical protein